jgi:hemerythrin
MMQVKMNLIEWSDGFNVNFKPIDEQHRQMAKTVNDLYLLLGSNKHEATKYLVKKLVDDVRLHFETEEKLMKIGNFQGYFSHKLEHDRFEKEIKTFYRKFSNGETDVNLQFLKLLKRWMVNHIEINDKKLGAHLNSLDNKEELLNQFETN